MPTALDPRTSSPPLAAIAGSPRPSPPRERSLVRGEIEINKAGSPGGNWVMQILATDAMGNPINTVLASTTIADASVPNGPSRLAAVFASPASVSAGNQYALGLTRPGA